MTTVENTDKALKSYYLEAITAQLDKISPFYAAIEKNSAQVYGKDATILAVRSDASCVCAGDEDGDLPTPAQNRYISISVPLKNIYGTIEVSDKALRASQNESGSIVNLLNTEMEALVESAKSNFSRMLFSDGSGYVATIVSKSGEWYKINNINSVYKGMVVSLYEGPDLQPNCENITVTDIDYSVGGVKFSYDPEEYSLADLDIRLPNRNGKEITGLKRLFDQQETVYGHDRTDTFFTPYEQVGLEYDEASILTVINNLEALYGSRPNIILCSYNTKKKIAELLKENKYVQYSDNVFNCGINTISFDGIPLIAEKYCDDYSCYFLNTDDFVLCQLCDWSWLEDESGKILKQVPGKAAYSATLVKYAELICKKPYAQGVLKVFT